MKELSEVYFFISSPISLLLLFSIPKLKLFCISFFQLEKKEIDFFYKAEPELLLGFFPQWLPTTRTLPKFQDFHCFKAEAKESSNAENNNRKCENWLLSRFLMNSLPFTMLCSLKLF